MNNGVIYEEQISVISAFVDGTVVYGTDKELTGTLRHENRNDLTVSENAHGAKALFEKNMLSLC